jgi:hypothetical protein
MQIQPTQDSCQEIANGEQEKAVQDVGVCWRVSAMLQLDGSSVHAMILYAGGIVERGT